MATAKLTSTRQYADEFSAREKVCGIYMITCVVNKKYYIGSSKNMRHRWLSHCHDLRKMKHSNLHLQRAYDLYGLREFRFTVLEYCPAEALLLREQFYIDIFDATNEQIGFNKAKVAGNPSKGTRRSVDASEKTAKYRRKVWQFVDPLGNPVTVTNLPAFCKENKLSQKSMACVGNGTTLKSYKGWRKLSDATRHTIHTKYKPCYDGEDRKSEFSLVDPMGITHTFKGIKASARRLGLGERGFHRVIQGKQEHHRGWRLPSLQTIGFPFKGDTADKNPGAKIHLEFISPSGQHIIVSGVKKFCEDKGLSLYGIGLLRSGARKEYKGWKLQ